MDKPSGMRPWITYDIGVKTLLFSAAAVNTRSCQGGAGCTLLALTFARSASACTRPAEYSATSKVPLNVLGALMLPPRPGPGGRRRLGGSQPARGPTSAGAAFRR